MANIRTFRSDDFNGFQGLEDVYYGAALQVAFAASPAAQAAPDLAPAAASMSLTFGSGRGGVPVSAPQGAASLNGTGGNSPLAKLQYGLAELYYEYMAGNPVDTGEPATQDFDSENEFAPIRGNMVAIDVVAANGDGAALLAALQAMGLEGGASFGRIVSGYIPIAMLDDLAGVEAIAVARPAYAITNVGAAENQGDESMQADTLRNGSGADGTGINIGIISDSFNFLGGYAADVVSGDLPAGVTVLLDNGSTDEGRGMAQLIHDVAPGATLGFHTANGGQAVFANGILALAGGGFNADIIVDDVVYFAEPFFQDGIIAQAVDTVTAGGVLYFSSAGNQASRSYEADFRESGVVENIGGFNYRLHDFDPGAGVDTRQLVAQLQGQVVWDLQWSDVYGSVSGGAGASTDLALIFRQTNGALIGIVDAANFDPIEIAGFTTGPGQTNYTISIGVFEGTAAPDFIKYVTFGAAFGIFEFPTNSSASFGHNNAEGAFSVAASPWFQTPVFGAPNPLGENFTSRGGTPIFYDLAGNELASPLFRDNVDFTAPDGGNTTFFGQDIAQDADAFPNFFGTSAAAPNAAALAALLLELHPTATRSEIEQALESTARDIVTTVNGTFAGPGYDRLTGAGLINAPDAEARLAAILANAAPVVDITGANATYTETAGANSTAGLPVPVLLGAAVTDGDDTLIEGAQVAITGGFQPGDVLAVGGSLIASYDANSGVLTISGSATLAQYGAILSSLTFTNAGDDPTNGGLATSRTISVVVNDGTENSLVDTATINVVGVNDAPINANAGADSLNEDQSLIAITGLSVGDPDADPVDVFQVTLQVSTGTLTIATNILGGVSAGEVSSNGTGTIVLTAPLAEINNTLLAATGVRYTPPADFNGNVNLAMFSVDLGATGTGGQQADFDNYTIVVNSVNDAPLGVDNTIFGLEETDFVFSIANFPFTDTPDGDAFASVVVTTLPATGTLRLNGVAIVAGAEISAADINAGLFTYTPSGSADSSFTFQVRDDGGTANGGVDLDPAANTLTLNIAANVRPAVDLNGPGGGTNHITFYTEGDAPIAITSNATVTDANSGLGDLIEQMTIEITNTQPGDQLTIDGALPAGITASTAIVFGDVVLTLSGAASAADYQTALNQVRYSSTNDDPTPPFTRNIEVVASDGDDNSFTRTTTVFVTPTNDGAVANSDVFLVAEDGVLSDNVFEDNGNGADDNPDGPLIVLAVNGDTNAVGQTITLASGAQVTLNADGTLTYDPNDAFNTLTSQATGAANFTGVDTFFYTLVNGSTAVVTVQIGGVRSTDDRLEGNSSNNIITDSSAFNDSFYLQQGGDDQANGDGGNDGFYFGAALTGADGVDGGTGTDSVAIQGNYGALVLGNIVNVENLVILPGSNASFGDVAGNFYDYDVTTIDGNVAAGGILTVIAADLRIGEDLVFDGSAESDGAFRIFAGRGNDDLAGGAGSDGFFFGQQANLNALDRVDGNGGIDSLALRGNYSGATAIVFQDASFVDVEVMVLLSGLTNQFGGVIDPLGFDYDLILADGNIGAGQRLDVVATGLGAIEDARVDARAELDGSVRIFSGAGNDVLFGSAGADFISGGAGDDQLIGGLGADTLQGNAGNDQYIYLSAADSTAAARDVIQGFAAGDKIDLQVIDANGAGAGNAAFTFIGSGAFTNVAGQLRYTQSGADAIVQGDTNGDGIVDFEILVTGFTPVAGDFIL